MASKKRQRAKKLAAKGASAAKIERKTGVSSKAANKFVAKAAAPAPSRPAPAPRISNKNSVGQNLRTAGGANNVLSNKELLKIAKKNDKNPEKILEKAVNKGMMIGSNVVNKYQKGAYTDPRTAFWRGLSPSLSLATGMDSPILNQIRSAGKQDKGSALFIGSKGSTATTLPRQMGRGNIQQPVPTTPSNTETPVNDGTQPVVAEDPITPLSPEPLPEEEMDPGVGMMSGGGMGAAGANKLGRAKSRLRKLGIYGRGTGLFGRGLQYGNALNK